MRRVVVLVLALAALWWSAATPAQAHVRDTTGYSTITRSGATVDYVLDLNYNTLGRAVGLSVAALETTDDAVRAAALRGHHDELLGYLDERIQVYADGAACEPTLNDTAMTRRDRLPFAEVDLSFACPSSQPSGYTVEYNVFRFDDGVIDGHTNIVDHTLGGTGGTERVVLDRAHTRFSTGAQSWWHSGWQFVTMGFGYILGGLDHILLVLALVIGARTRRALVENVVVFTLAHSIGLFLGALHVIWLPPTIVEPLIALSIAFVVLDGLLNQSRHRLWSILAFGLLHGLAFAGAVRADGGSTWPFVRSLVAFNLGIEAGQLLLLALAVPLVLGLRRLPTRTAWASTAVMSALIAGVGLFWFAEHLVVTSA